MSNFYPVRGSEGCSFHRLVDLSGLGHGELSPISCGWGINDGTDTAIYIRRHEEFARDAGKVAYFGEYGRRAADQSPAVATWRPAARSTRSARRSTRRGWATAPSNRRPLERWSGN